MANNKSVNHTVSPNQPVNISPGDEWYNVTTNKLYKAVVVGGTAVQFIEINLAAGSFTTLSASSTVSGTGFSTYLASPPPIGGTVAAAGSFTTLSASSTVSGTGFSTYLASPPAIGGTTAGAGSFTTVNLSAGTAARAPVKLIAGTNLTAEVAGAVEFDTANTIAYFTGNTTNGRGLIPVTQYFRLTANGTNTTTTIAPFFGTNSSIPLVANGIYEIEIESNYNKNTAGTLVWTLTNSAIVTNMTVNMLMSPVVGYTNVPSASAVTVGALIGQTAASVAFTATASISNNATMWSRFKIILENSGSTSVRLNVTNSSGTITPIRGSFWKATRIATVGTFAA